MAQLPWADVVVTERKTYSHAGAYDLCPDCGINRKRTFSKRCKACASAHRHASIPYSQADLDELYAMVAIVWACPKPCGHVFVSDHYDDEWVLRDAETVCPECGATLVLGQCVASLLDQEVECEQR